MIFLNRTQAGEKLAQELRTRDLVAPLVLAIPRGGVPVAVAVTKALSCPLDVIPLVKVPVPWMPEASYGAVAVDGTIALNLPLLGHLEVSVREMELAANSMLPLARERDLLYRQSRPFPDLAGRTAVIVDDGIGSGYSMLAAVHFVRNRLPDAVIVASPVASEAAFEILSKEPGIDRLVVLTRDPEQVFSLNAHYKDLAPVKDDDVVRSLRPA